MDGVVPHRLEMKAKVSVAGTYNFYDYWGDDLYREVMGKSRMIVNLASKEYSRCVEDFLVPGDHFITCIFGELEGNKIVQKGVYVKMARGDMVRFMAENRVETPEALKSYDRYCYHFDESRYTDTEYVFIRSQVPGKQDSPEMV